MTWTSILAYSLQRLTSKLSWNITWKREILYNLIGWGPPAITLILMKVKNLEGDAVFVKQKKNYSKKKIYEEKHFCFLVLVKIYNFKSIQFF